MAIIFDEINMLLDGVRLASRETEQLDLVNKIADFCIECKDIIDIEIMERLENSLLKAIDFANQIDYVYEDFIPLYQKVLIDFKMATDWYFDLFQKKPIISFVLTAYTDRDLFVRTMKSLFKYRNTEIEIVLMDCSETGNLKNIIKSFGDSGKVRYYRGEHNDKLLNEIDANIKCTGHYIFPVDEGAQIIIEAISDLIIMLKNNPRLGAVSSPEATENTFIDSKLLWKIAKPESELLLQAKEIQCKTGFGYKNDLIDLGQKGIIKILLDRCETSVELYRTIAYQLSDIYEFIFFGKSLYQKVKNS